VPITLAFVGCADPSTAARASAYEDAVLSLLTDHGSRVLARGRALPGQDPSLPHEVHLIWFPDRDALNSYMDDPRRHALLAEFGDVFTSTQVVEVELLGDTPLT
jgi:uncharacterized protein (DUF1330 family)